jgi:phosphopantetheinyl transferase
VTPAVVRVFSFDLDVPAGVAADLDAMLPAPERDAPPLVRVARGATRMLLAYELETEPGTLMISRNCARCGHPSHGRPEVVGADISFSLSHSGAFAMLACAAGGIRVGVDVEGVQARTRLDALAARVLSEPEHAAWSAIPDERDRLLAFLRAWTAREAYLKALGIGIVTRLRDIPARVDGWRTDEIDVGEAWIAALAVDRTDIAVTQVTTAPIATWNGGTGG